MNNLQKNLSAALVCSFQNTLCFSASPKHKCLPGCPHLLPQHLVSGQKGTQLHNQLLIVQKITHSAQRSEKEGINRQTASKYPNSCFLVAFINEGLTICFLKIWKNTVFNNCKKNIILKLCLVPLFIFISTGDAGSHKKCKTAWQCLKNS